MRPKILLRISSILMVVHAIGHSFGALNWKKATDPAVASAVAGMINNRFPFMGHNASLASFYDGYGISMIFVLLLISLFLWILAGYYPEVLAFRLLTVLTLFLFVLAVIEYIYFFPFAALFTTLSAVCAAVTLGKRRRTSGTPSTIRN